MLIVRSQGLPFATHPQTSAAALKQIRDRGYADAYRDDPRPVWLVGCNYSPKKRGLDKPRIVSLERS